MKRKISVGTAILLVITAVLLTFSLTLTFAWTTGLTEDPSATTEKLTPSTSYDPEKLAQIIAAFERYSVKGIPMDDLTDSFLKGFVAYSGDAYADYMTAEEYAAFIASYQGSFVGIGVTVQMDEDRGLIRVIDVTPNSPAEKAGFRFGDYILAVDGKVIDYDSLGDKATETLGGMIRGEEGTEVSVTVDRDGESVTLRATRGKVTAVSVRSKILTLQDKKVGYIQITSFDYPTVFQFKEAVDKAEAAGVDYMIYDLRNNGGGLLESVNAMLTYILPNKSLITTVESKLTTTKHHAGDRIAEHSELGEGADIKLLASGRVIYNEAYANHTVSVPSAVLINGYSASAAELFTSALRDHKVAKTVGENSYGKGCMQVTYDFSDGTALKLTTAFYNPPCGVNYDKTTEGPIGIAPDVEVVFTAEENKNNLYLIPPEKDRQFVSAFNALTDGEKLPVPEPEHIKI